MIYDNQTICEIETLLDEADKTLGDLLNCEEHEILSAIRINDDYKQFSDFFHADLKESLLKGIEDCKEVLDHDDFYVKRFNFLEGLMGVAV